MSADTRREAMRRIFAGLGAGAGVVALGSAASAGEAAGDPDDQPDKVTAKVIETEKLVIKDPKSKAVIVMSRMGGAGGVAFGLVDSKGRGRVAMSLSPDGLAQIYITDATGKQIVWAQSSERDDGGQAAVTGWQQEPTTPAGRA